MIPTIRFRLSKVRRSMACAMWMLGVVAASASGAAETDGATLVQQRRCYGCHHATQTLIGPSYSAIAARHAANRAAMESVLARKIIDGGAGNWGVVPMVPNEQVSAEEARTIARWILKQQ